MSSPNNIQAFQVLEPEKKNSPIVEEKQSTGKCWDARLLVFCVNNFVVNVGVSQIAPFYPEMASEKAGLNYTQIGMVFSINPLGSIVMSIVIGSMMMVWGRKRCLIVSLISQGIVCALFGCLNFMTENKALFLSMSMITRILQGASRSVLGAVTFAYIPLFWPNEFQQKLGIMESMTALGLLFGPMIGSVLNSLFGYSIPFFIIGTFFLLAVIPIVYLLPSDSEVKSHQKRKSLPIAKAFTSLKVVVTIMNTMTIVTGYIYFNPFFINHMQSYGINSNTGAFILTIPSLFYIINVNIVPRLQKRCLKTFLMSVSLLICFIGNMLSAPFYGVTDTIYPVIFGLMLVGVAQAFSTLPSIPQLIEILTPVINDPTLKSGVSDMAAALFIMSMGFGSLIGPLLGGSVYDHYGGNADRTLYPEQEKIAFRKALMILGLMQLIQGFIFLAFGDGYKGWQDLFRRCTQKQDKNASALNQPFLNGSESNSDGVLSDRASNSETDESIVNQSQSPLQTIKIVKNSY